MRLITVLNQCTKFKRFVFEESRLDEDGRILVSLRSRKNSRGECSGCGQLSPTYDTATDARRFEFVPVWGFSVFLVYRMRRVAGNAGGRVVIREGPLEYGQASPHRHIPVLSGAVGEEAVVGGGGPLLPDQLGQSIPFGPVCRGI